MENVDTLQTQEMQPARQQSATLRAQNEVCFQNLNSFSPFNDYSVSANLNGPIIPGRLTFYSSGRLNGSKGWLYGKQTFTMYGDTVFNDANNNGYRDNDENLITPYYKTMNWHDSWSTQNKFTIRLSPTTKLKFNSIINSGQSQGFDHNRRMVQEGRNAQYNSGQFYGINLSHSFSSRSFIELNTNQFSHRFESYLYEDPLDPRYITPDSLYWAHIEGTLPTNIATEYGQEVNYLRQTYVYQYHNWWFVFWKLKKI